MGRARLFATPFVVALAACGHAQTLNVFAAASLRESFQEIANRFQATHRGVTVHLSFAGSQQLAAQIGQGAPCDVFASADERNLEKVSIEPGSRRLFALNHLAVVTPASVSRILTFRDLSSAGSIVIANAAVPAGEYTLEAINSASKAYGRPWAAQLTGHVVSREQDVRAVLTKVTLGEADAGVVYATDSQEAGAKVRVVAVPDQFQPVIKYPMAIVKGSPNLELARQFDRFVLDAQGQRALMDRGFLSPLRPRPSISLDLPSGVRSVHLPLPAKMPRVKVTAVGPDKKPHTYRGVPLTAVLGGATGSNVTFTAADEYTVSLPLSQLLQANAVLIPNEGNLQLIVPGAPPHDWIAWIVSIQVR